MELEQSLWQITFIAFIAGGLIGAVASRYLTPVEKEVDRIKSELESTRAEMENYKAGVSQHFDKTGELVNELAQNYVKVYRHLAEGAETLSAGKTFPELLQQQNKAALAKEEESVVADEPPADFADLENRPESDDQKRTGV